MNNIAQLKKEMFQGFNTYYNNSVLTHVCMPECFAVSLGFKFYNGTYGKGMLLTEAMIGFDNIHPGMRSYDGTYTELTLYSHDHEIFIQSAVIDDDQYLLITPVKIAKTPPALLISASILWNRPGHVEINGVCLTGVTPEKKFCVFTDGRHIKELNTGILNPFLAVELSQAVAVSTDKAIQAGELKELMRKQKESVKSEITRFGELSEAYNAMKTCLAWDTIYEPENDQICSPVSRPWSKWWSGYVLFCWDTYFAAMMAMPDNKNLAYANLIAITHEKTEKGFIPNFGSVNDGKSRDRSQPPVGSLALKEIYRRYRENWIIEYLFDDLLEWNRWFADNRSLPDGSLCWGSDPYEAKYGRHWETGGINELLGAKLESGLDNSPMYDDIPFDGEKHIMRLADVGLTGLYIMDCEALAELADVIGRRPESGELRERAERSKNGLENMWDDEFGMYLNKRTDTGEFSRRISPTNFYALFSDKVSADKAERIIREHFFNKDEFYGEYMMPSIARNDPAYPDQNYWRGRIWAPMNFLAYIALRKHGLTEACGILAGKSKNLLLLEWNMNGHVHENYNADTGMGCDVNSSDRFYHWGALLSLIAMIDGGYIDGPENPLI
ncbi:MAG: hypothetical protein FWF92_06675 [Oscillospiraceae bacterium]|nr:hypothetical protein [Oscillospiraceae bacterium]